MTISTAAAAERFRSGESVAVVSWLHRAVTGGLSLAFGVTLVSPLWTGTEYAWVFVIPGIAFCVGAVRALRGASLRFEPDHVEVRTMWRTRRVPRDHVAGFGTTQGSNAFGLPWRVPYVKPASGPIITQEEIRSLRTGTVVDRSVDLGNVWLGQRA